MIKVILCSTIDEYIEYEDVIGAKDSYLMDFAVSDECSEEDAMKALDTLGNSKVRIMTEVGKTAFNFGDLIVKGMEQGMKEAPKLKRRIRCDNCGAIVDSSEELTSMPVLENYNNNQSVSDQLGSIDVCLNCLLEITDLL
ncbi:TPA: hypothetical protein KRL75_002512 [Clostridioides difficile]|uniref:hypothetical protein n=1 Tax=Clostridioides difficile TaxID=1496 RepID=UPI001025566D|nr:hypothetical protein [Clostridioides difficile]MBY1825512.1 hypothetical protein [Clostridioides difficile]VFC59203.1 Uncharacterised protein [Clostridioides difficile]HBF6521786.1 hypothetical protein [Clostridioides difficile]HBG5406047.1 hypothetical protein [Clostridioides difficile]HBH1435493.1 hypothetical protein [Clostridioides difficile]